MMEVDVDFEDSTNICRACLVQNENLINIFENFSTSDNLKLSDMFLDIFCIQVVLKPSYRHSYHRLSVSFQVNCNDRLPNSICENCRLKINDFYYFKKQCEKSNTILLEYSQYNKDTDDVVLNNENTILTDYSEIFYTNVKETSPINDDIYNSETIAEILYDNMSSIDDIHDTQIVEILRESPDNLNTEIIETNDIHSINTSEINELSSLQDVSMSSGLLYAALTKEILSESEDPIPIKITSENDDRIDKNSDYISSNNDNSREGELLKMDRIEEIEITILNEDEMMKEQESEIGSTESEIQYVCTMCNLVFLNATELKG